MELHAWTADTGPGPASLRKTGKLSTSASLSGKAYAEAHTLTGKEVKHVHKDGRPKMCFNWRDHGDCENYYNSSCPYAHPDDQRGVGKSKGGNYNNQTSATSDQQSGHDEDQGDCGGRSDSPQEQIIRDTALLCRAYLAGKCKRGERCKYHHNGPCKFFINGNCRNGVKCVFSHDDAAALPTSAPGLSTAPKGRAVATRTRDGCTGGESGMVATDHSPETTPPHQTEVRSEKALRSNDNVEVHHLPDERLER